MDRELRFISVGIFVLGQINSRLLDTKILLFSKLFLMLKILKGGLYAFLIFPVRATWSVQSNCSCSFHLNRMLWVVRGMDEFVVQAYLSYC